MNMIRFSIIVACSLGLATMAYAQTNPSDRAELAEPSEKVMIPDLAAHAAQTYRSQARFPGWSQPVAKGQADPVWAKREITRQTLPRGGDDSLTVWPSSMRYEQGDTVYVYAQITPAVEDDADTVIIKRPTSRLATWKMTAVVTGNLSGHIGDIVLRDDGEAGDERARDGIFTGAFVLPETYEPLDGYAENLVIVITAESSHGDNVKGITGVLYSNPAGHLTGRYEHQIVDGNLVIRAEVDAEVESRFHLSGTISDMKGEPLVSAQNAMVLSPGVTWVDLTFYGLALHESGVKGALKLSSLTLSSTNGLPNALGPVLTNVYQTGSYSAAEFHARPFARSDLMEQARRLEAVSAERQRALEKAKHQN